MCTVARVRGSSLYATEVVELLVVGVVLFLLGQFRSKIVLLCSQGHLTCIILWSLRHEICCVGVPSAQEQNGTHKYLRSHAAI